MLVIRCAQAALVDTATLFSYMVVPIYIPPSSYEKSHQSSFFPIVKNVYLQCFSFSFLSFPLILVLFGEHSCSPIIVPSQTSSQKLKAVMTGLFPELA